MRERTSVNLKPIPILMLLSLAACSGGDGDDLDKFIRNSGNGLKGKVDALPEVRPFQTVDFNADGTLNDPFVPMLEVTLGEHIGQNYGLVTAISDTEISLKEIVQDELSGDWVERPASVTLQE